MNDSPPRQRKPKPQQSAVRQPAYRLPEPIDDLFNYGGRLRDLRLIAPVLGEDAPGRWVQTADHGPPGAQPAWYDPERFEQLCDENAELQAALATLHAKGYKSSRAETKVRALIDNVFRAYLTEIASYYQRYSDPIGQYLIAKHAHYSIHPPEPEETPADAEPDGPLDDLPQAEPKDIQDGDQSSE